MIQLYECKLLVLDRNTWNHWTVSELFVLERNGWNHITDICELYYIRILETIEL